MKALTGGAKEPVVVCATFGWLEERPFCVPSEDSGTTGKPEGTEEVKQLWVQIPFLGFAMKVRQRLDMRIWN